MLEIHVTVNSPDIVQAISLLMSAIQGKTNASAAAPVAPAPAVVPSAPAAPTPMVSAPVAAAPSYTVAQVAKAGADLLQRSPALQPALVDLLGRYGAQTVQDLPHDKLGAFATELRQMGAQI